MADEQEQPTRAPLSRKANEERKTKEVATKLSHLRPMAKAEVVNDVVTDQINKQLNGFTNFLRDQSVIGIGIGLVLGTQLKTVVDSISADFVQPLTQLVLPNKKSLTAQVWHFHVAGRGTVVLKWGDILNSLLTFVTVALIVYAIFKFFKLDKLAKKK